VGDTLDRLTKLKQRQAKQLEKEIQEATKRKQLESRIRREEAALALRLAGLLGETIRDATLTPAEHETIAAIIRRREGQPRDWAKVLEWLEASAPKPLPQVVTEAIRAA
jgi:hypothetical protein